MGRREFTERKEYRWLIGMLLLVAVAACGEPTASRPDGDRLALMAAPGSTPQLIARPFDEAIDSWLEIHVDPQAGDDTTGSGAPENPLASLRAAMEQAVGQPLPRPTRIRLAAGRYRDLGFYENVVRSARSPIVISGSVDEDGQPATLVDGGADGHVAEGSNCIRFSSVAYLVVENIHCENAFPHGANIDDGSDYSTPTHHLVIRNWYIGNVGRYLRPELDGNSDCLKLSGVDDFWILDSEFEKCVKGEFIDMVGSHNGVIADNYFHDKPLNGIQTKGGSSDVLITRNVIARVEGRFIQLGGGTGKPYYRPLDAPYPASRIRVIANVLLDAGIQGGRDDHRSELFALNGCSDCLVAHNTAVGIQFQGTIAYIDREESERPGNRNVVLANNVYLMNDRAGRKRASARNPFEYRVSRRGADTAAEIRFENEVAFDIDSPDADPVDLPAELSDSQFSGSGFFDPMIDEHGRIDGGSPLIGFGARQYRDLVPGDFEERLYDNPPSVGAFAAPGRRFGNQPESSQHTREERYQPSTEPRPIP